MWGHVGRTHGLAHRAEDNTRNEHDDDFDGVQCEEGAEDEPRLIVQCPHTEDHRHYSIQRHSFVSLNINMKPSHSVAQTKMALLQ